MRGPLWLGGMLAAAALVVGCGGGGTLKAQGQKCFASSQCASGLVCDFGATPHVCAQMGTGGGSTADAGGAGIDAAPGAPDAAPGPPDASVPDASVPDAAPAAAAP